MNTVPPPAQLMDTTQISFFRAPASRASVRIRPHRMAHRGAFVRTRKAGKESPSVLRDLVHFSLGAFIPTSPIRLWVVGMSKTIRSDRSTIQYISCSRGQAASKVERSASLFANTIEMKSFAAYTYKGESSSYRDLMSKAIPSSGIHATIQRSSNYKNAAHLFSSSHSTMLGWSDRQSRKTAKQNAQ